MGPRASLSIATCAWTKIDGRVPAVNAEGAKLKSGDRARIFLVGSVVVTLGLFYVPYGRVIGYPLMLLSTLVHEMGHGAAAMLVGGSFEQFVMNPDGSGVATNLLPNSRFGRALVSAGGLVGPALIAGLGFVLGRTQQGARRGLLGFGALLCLSLLLFVRGWFGMLFVAGTAGLCLAIAIKAKPWASQVAMVFVSVQLALSVFSRGDYLFTKEAIVAGKAMPSDVQQMAQNLLLPYWFWGALCGAVSVAVLVFGLRAFFKSGEGT